MVELFVMVAPADPFRCPLDLMRESHLVAHYIKNNKPNSKIIVLDQKDKFSKQVLFYKMVGKSFMVI